MQRSIPRCWRTPQRLCVGMVAEGDPCGISMRRTEQRFDHEGKQQTGHE